MGHITYKLFNIYYYIQCETLNHTHISLFLSSMRLSASVIYHQELLLFPPQSWNGLWYCRWTIRESQHWCGL